jgi:UPF0755 protein
VKRLLVAATFLLATAIVAAGFVYSWGKARFESPGPLETRTIVFIPPGSGLENIAQTLAREGVIARPTIFIWGARLTSKARQLKAGEFAFPARVSPERALNIIISGKTVARKLTVPEGLTSAEVVALVRQAPALVGKVESVPPEGSLLPETYHYRRGDSRAALIRRMRQGMDALLDEVWPGRADDLPFDTRREAVTLASIVEKETAVPDERAMVAGVFVNRLRRGMRLQSDPTVRFALTEGKQPLDRPLTRGDLDLEHPFNTYHAGGLPPGPIANPGRAAIEAVLHPAETDFLYFVANGNGGHAFARTLREHNRNVAKWRRIRDGQSD